MAYPRFQRSRDFKRRQRTAGNVTVTAGAADFDTSLDIVLVAQVGDVIEYGVNGRGTMVSGSDGTFDVATIVSSAPVNYFGTGMVAGQGVQSWYIPNSAGNFPLSGSMLYTIVSGDLSAGTVTLRFRRFGGGAGASVVLANATTPFTVWAKNLGPQDPN